MTMNPPEDFFEVFEVFFDVDLDLVELCAFLDDFALADLEDTREDLSADNEVKGSADVLRDEEFCVFKRTLFSFLSKYSIAEDFPGVDRSWVLFTILFLVLSKYSIVTVLLPLLLSFSGTLTILLKLKGFDLIFFCLDGDFVLLFLGCLLYFCFTLCGINASHIWSISFLLGSTLQRSHVFLHCHCKYFSSVTLKELIKRFGHRKLRYPFIPTVFLVTFIRTIPVMIIAIVVSLWRLSAFP